ncbi:MAG TPA: exodeoxyribonuclease VII small subunit [Acidobacteriaceae bacterium]|jgi:exodeoxyribonuclease VII small subunit|nr:exodeoxyribonuclease VII small subunit [Acidobacteriaceae bacterium]
MAKFEEKLKGLEDIVGKLEKGDLPLEESIKLFEEGVKLSEACKQELEAAEGRVEVLLKQKNGAMKVEPFLETE